MHGKMTVLLVTGGIGSGKSAVCRHLESRGIPVYYADDRTKALYDTMPGLASRVDAAVGGGVLQPDGRVDRRLLSERIFRSAEKLSALESVVHPAVLEDFLDWSRRTGAALVVMESAIALRLEEYMRVFDAVILVDAPLELRVERACRRDGADRRAVEARAASQVADLSRVDAVIVNDSGMDVLYSRTDEAFDKLLLYLQNNKKPRLSDKK